VGAKSTQGKDYKTPKMANVVITICYFKNLWVGAWQGHPLF